MHAVKLNRKLAKQKLHAVKVEQKTEQKLHMRMRIETEQKLHAVKLNRN